jgi:ADP-ribosylglycohydrolase
MQAGENTLNAHCARVVMRMLIDNKHHYHKELFLDDYITFMTADPPLHHDTYAESYHRGFFANLQQGRPTDKCGAVTHDTASIGGLVTIAPIVFSERLQATAISEVQHICKQHLYLTHPDAALASICQAYVELLDKLMFRTTQESVPSILAETAKNSIGIDLKAITEKANSDLEVIGGKFSSACYISDSWPSVLYLAYKYHEDLTQALIINTNLGGDNVHRGIILGTILGLANGTWPEHMFNQLLESDSIHAEISALIGQG